MKTLLALLLTVCCTAPACALSKCTDASGKVTFSDLPCQINDKAEKPIIYGRAKESGGAEVSPVTEGADLCKGVAPSALLLKDRASAIISVTQGGFSAIEYKGIKTVARRYFLSINSKNSYGAYTGDETYVCYTSNDGKRFFSVGKGLLDL